VLTVIIVLAVVGAIGILVFFMMKGENEEKSSAQKYRRARSTVSKIAQIQEKIASEQMGEYATDITEDSRLEDVQNRIQKISSEASLTMKAGDENLSYAVVLEWPDQKKFFCLDNGGDSSSYNAEKAEYSSVSDIIDTSGEDSVFGSDNGVSCKNKQ
jgi:type II secretory pathway pseudopilin PulG